MIKVLESHDPNVQLLEYDTNMPNSVVGLYIQNGVLIEGSHQEGISYLLDDFLYNEICDEFSDLAEEIKTRTYYDFSEFVFVCKRKEINKILDRLERFINNYHITDQAYFKRLQKCAIKRCKKHKRRAKDIFNQQYYDCERLFDGIVGDAHTVAALTVEQLNAWFDLYWKNQAHFLCICNPEMQIELKGQWLPESQKVVDHIALPPHFCHRDMSDIFCLAVKSKFSEVICSFDCPADLAENPFAVETICLIWELELSTMSLMKHEAVEKTYVYFDHNIPRIFFEFYVRQNRIAEFLCEIMASIRQRPTIMMFQTALTETLENNRYFAEDMYQMNQEAGKTILQVSSTIYLNTSI